MERVNIQNEMQTQIMQSDKNEKQEVVIESRNLYKAFDDKVILKDITFKLYRNENIVVLGKSGTGKSVLIKCISGLIHPDGGQLNVLGKNVFELKEDEWTELRRRVGFLFQSGALYDSMTVKENLEFPLKRQIKERSQKEIKRQVEEALDNVGLLDAINKMPAELSGGMQKRVALARTLILKPEIMLYDEPTTGLDPVTSREISDLILQMQKKYKISSIIITHDMACAEATANRVMVIKDGVFEEEGTFKELKHSENKWVRSFFI